MSGGAHQGGGRDGSRAVEGRGGRGRKSQSMGGCRWRAGRQRCVMRGKRQMKGRRRPCSKGTAWSHARRLGLGRRMSVRPLTVDSIEFNALPPRAGAGTRPSPGRGVYQPTRPSPPRSAPPPPPHLPRGSARGGHRGGGGMAARGCPPLPRGNLMCHRDTMKGGVVVYRGGRAVPKVTASSMPAVSSYGTGGSAELGERSHRCYGLISFLNSTHERITSNANSTQPILADKAIHSWHVFSILSI